MKEWKEKIRKEVSNNRSKDRIWRRKERKGGKDGRMDGRRGERSREDNAVVSADTFIQLSQRLIYLIPSYIIL